MITNSYSSAPLGSTPIPTAGMVTRSTAVPAADPPATSTASRLLDLLGSPESQSVGNSPSDRLQQFVSVLFQALEQNQSYIQQLQTENLSRQQAQELQARERQQQNPYASDTPPLVKDLESLVERLSDTSSNNDDQPAVQQLQRFYQETPLRSAYPNLPLGTMLQKLQQSLNSDSPESLPRQGSLLDTKA